VLVTSGIALLLCAGLTILSGVLADRFGRKPILVPGVVIAVVGSVPAYVVVTGGSLVITAVAVIMLGIPAALVGMTTTIIAVELVPPRIRSTITAVTYNIAVAVFGGSAPLVGAVITAKWGKLAPGAYITIVALIALIVVLVALRETRSQVTVGPSTQDDPEPISEALPST
jgi:MHS family proline/betaine transporter-like MFS transporter